MHFMTEQEELLKWMKEHEEFKVMNKEDAQILLNYMEGHDYRLGTDKDGSLVRVDINTDEYEAEPYSLDDVIDIVCEWNDELIRYTSQELNELSQGQDKSLLEVKLASLKQDEIRLDKMFEQTKYPAEIEALAVQLADAFIERLGLVTGDNYMRKIIKKLVKERMDGLIEKCGIKEFMNYATVIQRVHIVDTDFSTDFKYYTEENFELSDMFHNYEMCVGLYIRVKEECSETFQSSLSSELKPLLDDDIIDVTIEKMEDEDYEKYANNEEYDTNNSEYIEFSIRGDKYSE